MSYSNKDKKINKKGFYSFSDVLFIRKIERERAYKEYEKFSQDSYLQRTYKASEKEEDEEEVSARPTIN